LTNLYHKRDILQNVEHQRFLCSLKKFFIHLFLQVTAPWMTIILSDFCN